MDFEQRLDYAVGGGAEQQEVVMKKRRSAFAGLRWYGYLWILLASAVPLAAIVWRADPWRYDYYQCAALSILFSGLVVSSYAIVCFRLIVLMQTGRALWDLTSSETSSHVRAVNVLAKHFGAETRSVLEALRRHGAELPGEVDANAPDEGSPARLPRIRLLLYFWGPASLGLAALLLCIDRAVESLSGFEMFANDLSITFLATVCISAAPWIFYGLFWAYRRNEAIWKLNGSERAEKIEGARQLSVWGRGRESFKELSVATNDPDTVAATAAKRASIVITMWKGLGSR